ncbi:abortive infection family protein [Allocoleopsis franciscana]|uniref:Abortive infection protein-like C-terminal domain-containing protein n=1 Tax=Allocoleopsis franciscana PCC 7113 TaxID=1173027 RepID=K9WQ53_9CYAN|nr:abortive infection family protein [Allocoleopsis franciscana]AFZ22308.1 hypothetical protein Mic7113_6746 [Allocoleopsis franciscana PCC 7113]
MQISGITISQLALIITGDSNISPYRSRYQLIDFFQEIDSDNADREHLSRREYTECKIKEANGTSNLPIVFRNALDPRNFLETTFELEEVVKKLNVFLEYDKYKIVKIGEFYEVKDNRGMAVELELPFEGSTEISHVFIEEQIQKCERKIREGDFDGAITNARSLLEAVLLYVEKKLSQSPPEYDGKLPKLYTRVQELLNLEPSRKDISQALIQMLQGLTSVVSGLAGVSNMMADRHARKYKPAKHHAVVSVNASKTVADFIFETFSYQLSKGSIGLQTSQTISADEAADPGISKS